MRKIWASIIFIFCLGVFSAAAADYGYTDISQIPGSEVTDFMVRVSIYQEFGQLKAGLETDYPFEQFGYNQIRCSFYRDTAIGHSYYCDLSFLWENGRFVNNGFGGDQHLTIEAAMQTIRDSGLQPEVISIMYADDQETKELCYLFNTRKYDSYSKYTNEFFYGCGWFIRYSYDQDGKLKGTEATYRYASEELQVFFDKYGRIKKSYFRAKDGTNYIYQKMTGLFATKNETKTMEETGFDASCLLAPAAVEDPNAPPDPDTVEVMIPDPVFREQALAYDTDYDGMLSQAEAGKVYALYLRNMGIRSLCGIEYFTGLRELWCDRNEIEYLDLGNIPGLNILYCEYNHLTSLILNPACRLKMHSYLHNEYHILSPFDLNNLPGPFDMERTSGWSVQPEGSVLRTDSEKVTYTYYTGVNYMTCTLIIDDNIPEPVIDMPESISVSSAGFDVSVKNPMAGVSYTMSGGDNATAERTGDYSWHITPFEVGTSFFTFYASAPEHDQCSRTYSLQVTEAEEERKAGPEVSVVDYTGGTAASFLVKAEGMTDLLYSSGITGTHFLPFQSGEAITIDFRTFDVVTVKFYARIDGAWSEPTVMEFETVDPTKLRKPKIKVFTDDENKVQDGTDVFFSVKHVEGAAAYEIHSSTTYLRISGGGILSSWITDAYNETVSATGKDMILYIPGEYIHYRENDSNVLFTNSYTLRIVAVPSEESGLQESWSVITFQTARETGEIQDPYEADAEQVPDQVLVLPADLTRIESQSFAGLSERVAVELPGLIEFIADDAFENSDVVLIVKNDYSKDWAKTHKVFYTLGP